MGLVQLGSGKLVRRRLVLLAVVLLNVHVHVLMQLLLLLEVHMLVEVELLLLDLLLPELLELLVHVVLLLVRAPRWNLPRIRDRILQKLRRLRERLPRCGSVAADLSRPV